MKSSAGFTMMEMMIALAIFSLAFGTIYKSFVHLNRSTTTENVKAGTQQAVRIAVDFMVQDIRLAGLNPLETPGIGIQAATSDSIQFTMDANFDGDDADTFENITYTFNAGAGTLWQFNPPLDPETLIDNVSDLNFTYLDTDEQTTGDFAEIRSVIISLTMQRPAGRDEDVSRTYTTQVRCRNL
ncbi:MAG: prepilin-type N-terminal cleavage/methylation domain-containing protein [Deltaproteobacteria bacterium]|nr:prepilin-type N-terminal cleavage/methylation domain-containing protein [Deltaproteobacteria bacterium]